MTPDEHHDVLGDYIDRADAWLRDQFGSRLYPREREAIVRVMFDRAWRCKSEMDADALLHQTRSTS